MPTCRKGVVRLSASPLIGQAFATECDILRGNPVMTVFLKITKTDIFYEYINSYGVLKFGYNKGASF